jgi:hypothetical protein
MYCEWPLALIIGFAIFLVSLLFVLKYIARLKWSTSICLVVLTATLLRILGWSALPPHNLKIEPVILLPGALCAIILIIQFLCWAVSGDYSTVNAAEREKILRMVEDSKISTDEGTELLDAIGRSTALRGQEKFSRADIVILVGAALVILGFFLPWVYFRMPKIGNVWSYQAGYDWRALGWAIFIIGVLSAVPVFVTPKDFLYKISMLQIFLTLIGLALVISVLVRVGSHLGAGIIFCLVAFVIELFASAAKLERLAA